MQRQRPARSITRSGINTRNLQITDEAGQIRQTGLTAEETRAKVYTGTTTESARADVGSLHNRFDKERVENEINLQRNVSQNFGHNVQQANGEINRHLDHLKEQLQQGKISQAEYDRQMALWQRGQVLLNSIASGLSAPTQSGAGIAANAVSPAVSYQIGQYFKELAANNRDGQLSAGQEAAHILAHTVWGAAVAHAGGNNALAGALAAGGPEAAAPIISHYLYQERDGSRLSAEQKETVTAIAGLIGTAAGAALGNTPADAAQGSLNAKNSVENNTLSEYSTKYETAHKELHSACMNKGVFTWNSACQNTYMKWMQVSAQNSNTSLSHEEWNKYAQFVADQFQHIKNICGTNKICLSNVSLFQIDAIISTYGRSDNIFTNNIAYKGISGNSSLEDKIFLARNSALAFMATQPEISLINRVPYAVQAIEELADGIKNNIPGRPNKSNTSVGARDSRSNRNNNYRERTMYVGNRRVNQDKFHREIKPEILSSADSKYKGIVGTNPDVSIRNGKIILIGQGEHKGKTFETGMDANRFFGDD